MATLPPAIANHAKALRAELRATGPVDDVLIDEVVTASIRLKLLHADPRAYDPLGDPAWARAHEKALRAFFRCYEALNRRQRPSQRATPPAPSTSFRPGPDPRSSSTPPVTASSSSAAPPHPDPSHDTHAPSAAPPAPPAPPVPPIQPNQPDRSSPPPRRIDPERALRAMKARYASHPGPRPSSRASPAR